MTIHYQLHLRPAIPNIYGVLDYREVSNQLEHIDTLVRYRGTEKSLAHSALKRWQDK